MEHIKEVFKEDQSVYSVLRQNVHLLVVLILLSSSAQHRNTELHLQKRRALAITYGRRKRRSLNVCATSNSLKTPPQKYLLNRAEDGGMKLSLREI